jgi:tetratricopeptide (TPR) repeat protein
LETIALLSFALGAATGVSALLLLARVGFDSVRPGGRSKALAAAAFAIPLVALVIYLERPASPRPGAVGTALPQATADADALDEDDWTLLAHMYAGGPPPGSGGGTAAALLSGNPHTVEEMTAVTAREPGNVGAWLALGGAQRRARDFAAAAASYERALKLDEANPDAWADYADALASAGSRQLAGAPAKAIARALELDARHPKALWLQASLDLELRRYAQALARWQQLRAVLPQGSADIPIVDANIAEARQLAAAPAAGG